MALLVVLERAVAVELLVLAAALELQQLVRVDELAQALAHGVAVLHAVVVVAVGIVPPRAPAGPGRLLLAR